MKKTCCVVAGGAGFIGRHLCKTLLDQGQYVVCIDNLISGSELNIKEFYENPNFLLVRWDISNPIPEYVFANLKIIEIYNFACIASPDKYKKYAIETLNTCFLGNQNLIKLAIYNEAKYLFASTSEVYGDPYVHPQPETYYGNVNTVGERSCYDEGKRVAETLIYEYRRKYGLDAKIIRIFNTYGPYMSLDDGRVITNFLKCVRDKKPVVIYGDGEQTRSFCYIDDLVNGIMKMMATEHGYMGPVNLGNPDCEFSINELVDVFQDVIGKPIEVEYRNATMDDPKQRKPDLTVAQKKLGFEPKVDLKNGIQQMINSMI